MDAKVTLEIAELFPVLAADITFENGHGRFPILRLLRYFGVVPGQVHVCFHFVCVEDDGANGVLGLVRLLTYLCVVLLDLLHLMVWLNASHSSERLIVVSVTWF